MNIGRIGEQSAQISATMPKTSAQESQKKTTTLATDNTDKFVKESEATFTPAYTKATVAKKSTDKPNDNFSAGISVQRPTSLTQMKNEAFKAMVKDTIGTQSGIAWEKIISEKAQIEEGTIDDYWGVDATAQRIFDFAKNLSGGDGELLQTLRDAVEEGFSQAGALFGKKSGQDKLPQICNDTYDKVMELFDSWEEELNAVKPESAEQEETK